MAVASLQGEPEPILRRLLWPIRKLWKLRRPNVDELGTKLAIAEILAKKYPEELGSRLPPKRRLWMSEDYRMDILVQRRLP